MRKRPVMDGLAMAEKYYYNYGMRARELKAEGDKILGYLSELTPVEIMTAARFVVPVRLKGSVSQSIAKGDAVITDTMVCPLTRNLAYAVTKEEYGFLDGIVTPYQCDSIDRVSDMQSYKLKLPYWYSLSVPSDTQELSVERMEGILRAFLVSLEGLIGFKITDVALALAITSHLYNSRLMRQLYALRKTETPLISGTDMTKILAATASIPAVESSALIESVMAQIEHSPVPRTDPRKRIMLIGEQIYDVRISQAIEEAGAWLVMDDDTSIGGKLDWNYVDISKDPLRAIAERYLRKLKIPTTLEALDGSYQENLEARFGHIRRHIEEFKVDGVVLLVCKYCDLDSSEVPAIKSYIESTGTPVLCLEDIYSSEQLKTRIEAFPEMIALEQKKETNKLC